MSASFHRQKELILHHVDIFQTADACPVITYEFTVNSLKQLEG